VNIPKETRDDILWLIDNCGDATTGDFYGEAWRRVAGEVRVALGDSEQPSQPDYPVCAARLGYGPSKDTTCYRIEGHEGDHHGFSDVDDTWRSWP
jgi:hypothetical protein